MLFNQCEIDNQSTDPRFCESPPQNHCCGHTSTKKGKDHPMTCLFRHRRETDV